MIEWINGEQIADVYDDGTTTIIEVDNEDIPVITLALSLLGQQLDGSDAGSKAAELSEVLSR